MEKEFWLGYYAIISAACLLLGLVIGGLVSNEYWRNQPPQIQIERVEIEKEVVKYEKVYADDYYQECLLRAGDFLMYNGFDGNPVIVCKAPERELFRY